MGLKMTVLRFSTTMFGSSNLDELGSNPPQGHALAEMLRMEFMALDYRTDDRITERKWGWTFNVQYYRQVYMVGTFAYSDFKPITDASTPNSGPISYLIQFDKNRTLLEKIFGRNKFADDEPIIDLTIAVLKFKIPDLSKISKVV